MQVRLTYDKKAVIQKGVLGLKWRLMFGSEKIPPNAMATMKLKPPIAPICPKLLVRLLSSGLISAMAARQSVKFPANNPVKSRLKNNPVKDSPMTHIAVKVYPI